MNEKDAIGFLERCVRFYSPSGKEKPYSLFLAKFLESHGFKVNFDKVGNLNAEKGEGKPVLLLSSHMDTIPGELPIYQRDGKLYGRGTVDCKSSLASMVYSICQFDFTSLDSGKIIFAGIIQEENSLLGIKEFIKSEINPDYAIFGEPTSIDQICIGYKGRLCIGYSISTEKGHVASAWLYKNAIEISLDIWDAIKNVCAELTKKIKKTNDKTKYFDQIIPNLTVISGGTVETTNVIPDEASIQVDIRFPPSIKSERLLNILNDKINHLIKEHERQTEIEIKLEDSVSSQVEGYELKGNSILTGALRWSVFKTINRKPKLIKKTGTTFINQIGITFKIPSITYGPGDPKLEHSDGEFVEIKEYLDVIKVYNKFLGKLFDLHKRKYES